MTGNKVCGLFVAVALALLTACEPVSVPTPYRPPPLPVSPPPALPPAIGAETEAPPPANVALLTPPQYSQPPVVRVWLSDVSATPSLSCDGPCRLRPTKLPERILPRLNPVTIQMDPKGIRVGSEVIGGETLELRTDGTAQIKVDGRAYPGTVRIMRAAGNIAIINELDIESYLEGVLGSEMPTTWPAEALKAQAVAARSYALYSCLSRQGQAWDITSTVEDQVYSGRDVRPSVMSAVRATSGQVLLHEGKCFPAFFHSTCGGKTKSPGLALGRPEFDFLAGVDCPHCVASPHHRWQARLTGAQLGRRFKAAGEDVGMVIDIQAVDPVSAGPRQAMVTGQDRSRTLSMVDFRRIVGRMDVRSGEFVCTREGETFVFTGRGLGHGAGMCQWGAKGMAEAARDYKQIVAHYYSGCALGDLY